MEKLIEYYNEYYQKENLKEYYDYIKDMVLPEKFDSLIFLKDFCKWLVDNDKISNNGIKPRTDLVKEITIVDYKTGDVIGWKNKYTELEQLIMYLSIQDEPISFLCSILK